jgi:hypothetical protein
MEYDEETINEVFVYFKQEIREDVSRFIRAYEYEDFDGLFIYPKDKKIEIISKRIIELNELINKRNNFPFVSYNFTDGVFEEDLFFDNFYFRFFEEGWKQEIILLNLKTNTQHKLFKLFSFVSYEDVDKVFFESTSIYKLYQEIRNEFYDSKKLEFLILKRSELTGDFIKKDNLHKVDNNLQWYGSQSELIELAKALIINGNLKGNQEKIFESIQKAFNFELNNVDQAITKFNGRSAETETKFLNKLKESLSNYISIKLNKNR